MSDAVPPPTDAPPPDAPGAAAPAGGGARGYDRVPPHSLDAEVSVLGASLLSRAAASDVVELLRPDDFYRNAHRVVFEAVRDLTAAGEAVDTVTVTEWLARRDRLDEVGGPAALHDLTVAVPTAANASYYARIVRDNSLRRRLIDAGTDVVRLGYESTDEVDRVVDQAESMIYDVAQDNTTSEYERLGDLLNVSFQQIEQLAEDRSEVTGLATGFDDLDRLTAGLQPSNLVVLAARPAMGKCLTGSARVIEPKTGARTTIADVVRRGRAGERVTVAALDEVGSLISTDVSAFHDNGVRPTRRITTRSGRCTEATSNHPFLTPTGWRELEELAPGDLIAVPRTLPWFGDREVVEAEAKLLGYLLGDGCLRGRTPTLTTGIPAIAEEAADLASAFGTSCQVVPEAGAWTLSFRSTARLAYDIDAPANWLTKWLEDLGLWGCDAHQKFVPDVVFEFTRERVAQFLSRLFATDGSVWVNEKHGYFGVSYSSVSRRLVSDVQHLLLRFSIRSSVRERRIRYLGGFTRSYELEIRDAPNVRRFLGEIGVFAKEEACDRVASFVDRRSRAHSNTDLLPLEVWDLILHEKGDRSWASVSAATGRPRNHNWHVGKRRPSRRLVRELAEALGSVPLMDVACSDVLWDEVVDISDAGEQRVYDVTVPGLHNFVADDLIAHNSSLVLGVSHFVSARLGKPSLLFSLEMSKLEIVNRLLSSEARIDSSRLRTGRLEDTDWRKLGDALGHLAEAPLFIDDTPSITIMEIRAKARRLKAKHGLDLVIVDYLQLMQGNGRTDSRQQEVAEFSRGLKMLAKELDVPVIALSQLSRQPEARTDKRPMLADLRESGCLTRGTRLFRADTGVPTTLGELLDRGLTDVPVWATDHRGRVVAGNLTHAFPSGVKPTYRVRLASGLTVEATGNHPFRTPEGWTPLEDLDVGARVGSARQLPEPPEPVAMDPDELVLLAHLLGEGTIVARQPIHYTSADEANLDAVEKAAWLRFGIAAERRDDARSSVTTQLYLPAPGPVARGRRNPIAAWLDELGIWDRRSWQKQLPATVFGLPREQLATFLHHLWATDGCLHVRPADQRGPRVSLYYATSSEQLATDVQLLLRRFGLLATIRTTAASERARSGYQVWIYGSDQQRRFLDLIGVHGTRGELVPHAREVVDGIDTNPNVDVLPIEVWSHIRQRRRDRGLTDREFQAALGMSYCGRSIERSAPSRDRLHQIADVLDDDTLRDLATDDIVWDRIERIEPIGDQPVFDATVDEHHCFVAEGLILHNSIEQDADIVGFIYRDEVYNEDSPDQGIAELIIAKHRNGATGIVKLAFLNHLTKFANLARAGGQGAAGQSSGGQGAGARSGNGPPPGSPAGPPDSGGSPTPI